MEEQPTCGKGLAENSVLPAKLGELTAALAEVLQVHTKALDVSDENSHKELDAYLDLAKQSRETAARLHATDLPMGRHDFELMASPEPLAAFEKFVRIEEELLAMLEGRLEKDRQMLSQMGAAR